MEAVVLFLAVLASVGAQDGAKIVNINQGPVRGYKASDYDTFAFYGIPYATAPTGRDKFKAPLPPPNWTEPFEAVERDIRCPQNGLDENFYREDCLVANVYIPDTDEINLPVVFFVHGGGFQFGYGNLNTPHQFVNYKKNVILVTFNYRLGPHGYLCLGTEEAPGNGGSRDQVAALKWVHENIAHFGGNPDDIIISGCSAGGVSVELIQLSKTANGLYKKMIGLSGTSLDVFAIQEDPTENARNYAKEINYDGPDNISDIQEFYLNASYEELFSLDLGQHKNITFVFSPCVERDLGTERFLDDAPINIIRKGDYPRIPVLYGWTDMEGLYRLEEFEEWKNDMNEDFSKFLPADLEFDNIEQKQEVAEQIKNFYFGEEPVSGDNILSYIDFHTDVMFVVAMQRAITMQVKAGNDALYIFVYSYVYNGTSTVPYTNAMGSGHCDQYRAVFDQDERVMSPEDVAMKQTMRDLWLNFIYTGEPTPDDSIPFLVPKWEPAKANRTPCMELGNTIQVLPGAFAEDRQAFWDNIYDRYHRKPVPPYDF